MPNEQAKKSTCHRISGTRMSKKKKDTRRRHFLKRSFEWQEKVVYAHLPFFTLHFVYGFLSFQINVLIESYTFLQAISSFAYAFGFHERQPPEHESKKYRHCISKRCSTTVGKIQHFVTFVEAVARSSFYPPHYYHCKVFAHRIQMSSSTFPSSSTSVDDLK